MIRRLIHFLLTGHDWKKTGAVYCPASNPERTLLWMGSDYEEKYGFTVTSYVCPCGARMQYRELGDWTSGPPEIAELTRMFLEQR